MFDGQGRSFINGASRLVDTDSVQKTSLSKYIFLEIKYTFIHTNSISKIYSIKYFIGYDLYIVYILYAKYEMVRASASLCNIMTFYKDLFVTSIYVIGKEKLTCM